MSAGADAEQWDVFISHASEDKEKVARPLAAELQKAGLKVWLDAQELTLGDSLRQRIDDGLRKSRFGAVILSNAFFSKDWPQRELNALLALETRNRKVLLPVLHGLSADQLARFSPILADKLSASTDRGLQHVAIEIVKAVSGPPALEGAAAQASVLELDDLEGRCVGAYTLGAKLGAGGSGVVYRAAHKDLGPGLAIKLFYPLAAEYRSFDRLFDRGFKALSRLNHPNIVSVKDFGRAEIRGSTLRYLVMDFIAGPNLQEWSAIIDQDPNALEKRLATARKVSNAMLSAHETVYVDDVGFEVRGVLHGDLKPSNVLVGPHEHPIVLDFLLVDVQRLLDPRIVPPVQSRVHEMDLTTRAFGTPGFMAPEQAQHGVVSAATDVYGLGITLYHLFFPSHHSPQMAAMLDKKFPADLKNLLDEMTLTDVQQRLRGMAEVARRLERAGPLYGMRKWLPSFLRR